MLVGQDLRQFLRARTAALIAAYHVSVVAERGQAQLVGVELPFHRCRNDPTLNPNRLSAKTWLLQFRFALFTKSSLGGGKRGQRFLLDFLFFTAFAGSHSDSTYFAFALSVDNDDHSRTCLSKNREKNGPARWEGSRARFTTVPQANNNVANTEDKKDFPSAPSGDIL